jgi:stage IV sporulation protein FB
MLRQPESSWSIGLGHWWGTALRIHLSLLLGCALVIAFAASGVVQVGLIAVAVWIGSVLLHDLAHAFSAVRLGGRVDAIVLGPVGGLWPPQVPDEPEPQVFVALAGPIVHLSLVVASTGALVYQGATDVLALLTSIAPSELFTTTAPGAVLVVKLTLWINWMLFLLNWISVYPFDAAPALRALLWPLAGRRSAAIFTSRLGLGVSVALFFAALYFYSMVGAASHVWGTFLLLAIFSAVSAQRDLSLFEEAEADAMVDDYWKLNMDDEDLDDDEWLRDDSNHMVLVEQHYDQLRERYERQRKAQEDYEDARVDDILARMHDDGFERLSHEDKAFLRRASRRYRDRRRDSLS